MAKTIKIGQEEVNKPVEKRVVIKNMVIMIQIDDDSIHQVFITPEQQNAIIGMLQIAGGFRVSAKAIEGVQIKKVETEKKQDIVLPVERKIIKLK